MAACGSEESPGSQRTSGGESALETAGRNIDGAHRDFKQAIRPAADFVDDKSNEAVAEARKATIKVRDAITGDDASRQP